MSAGLPPSPAPQSPVPDSVFVYGTLKPGLRYHGVARRAGAFAAHESHLDGFDLYHLEPENYPALIRGTGRVCGWRYSYRDIGAALAVLDALEGVHAEPPEYERVLARCGCSDELVWVYLYRDEARLRSGGTQHVPSGVWLPRAGLATATPRSCLEAARKPPP